MKRYFYEAPVTQWEKPTQSAYVFCAPARCNVYAENEAEAEKLAIEKFNTEYYGTGRLLLNGIKLTKTAELPIDWSYGYGDERVAGATNAEAVAKLTAAAVIA